MKKKFQNILILAFEAMVQLPAACMHIYDCTILPFLKYCATEQDENHLMLNRVLHNCGFFGEKYILKKLVQLSKL